MTGAEQGFLLLTSHLGDPSRQVLTTAQFRTLADRVNHGNRPMEERELTASDLIALGYGRDMAERILRLLSEEDLCSIICPGDSGWNARRSRESQKHIL